MLFQVYQVHDRLVDRSAAGYVQAYNISGGKFVAQRAWGVYSQEYVLVETKFTLAEVEGEGLPVLSVNRCGHLVDLLTLFRVPTYNDLETYTKARDGVGLAIQDGGDYWLGDRHGVFNKLQNIFDWGDGFAHRSDTVYQNADIL